MKAELTVENTITDQSSLLCPNCGEGYLHQGAIEVYDSAKHAGYGMGPANFQAQLKTFIDLVASSDKAGAIA